MAADLLNVVECSIFLENNVIRKQWHDLIRPHRLEVDAGAGGRVASVVAAPLERGFGVTLGNALRRVLLSSLRGAAARSIRIDGVLHEFSTVPGVLEDVTNIILNVKSMALKMDADGTRKMKISVTGPCDVRAGMFELGSELIVLDPEHHICTVGEGAQFNMEVVVGTGRGYVPAVKNHVEDAPAGTIFVDSLYSPIMNVAYKVENTRVGQDTDYDKLILTVETNGAIVPADAVALGAKILQDQLARFINFSAEDEEEANEKNEPSIDFPSALLKKIDDLELSVRSMNCLRGENIVYIGDLVHKTEAEMLKTPNFGRKSLNEIKAVLSNLGLSFGLNFPSWPPENIEELAKAHEKF